MEPLRAPAVLTTTTGNRIDGELIYDGAVAFMIDAHRVSLADLPPGEIVAYAPHWTIGTDALVRHAHAAGRAARLETKLPKWQTRTRKNRH